MTLHLTLQMSAPHVKIIQWLHYDQHRSSSTGNAWNYMLRNSYSKLRIQEAAEGKSRSAKANDQNL